MQPTFPPICPSFRVGIVYSGLCEGTAEHSGDFIGHRSQSNPATMQWQNRSIMRLYFHALVLFVKRFVGCLKRKLARDGETGYNPV